ncbi:MULTISPECIES: TetR/AcrR family transcriptional regulator [unclassified Micromonospora]|uniref:TetR/AcrR family transcriptional regulator n=1 Tax=unclassified Micromonospora TaxID=2617518 RepID=UPI001C5D7DD5|nr:TetR/AcrR family transcriptional regulator C-terminal domain-containing protein [Micromonospora sp. RL09-050-HVF-A]MBW4705049.1 TetR/AcrR family transcriptional regulator C-terminal domain-containing protein [Micromonospora sp. RL09-050-HVF-A]
MDATELSGASAERHGGRSDARAGAVWLRAEPTRNRRATPLTRERIVTAAVALLDRHGIDGLTMRRLAEHLTVTPTALYWHVTTKEDVLDLAVDHIFGEVPLPAAGSDWRDDVHLLTSGWRAAMLRHPWAPGLIGRPMLGPHVLARTEFLQSALVRAGFTGLDLAVVTRLVANYVIGAALTEATWHQTGDPEVRAEARRHLVANAASYPTLTASGHLDDRQWSDDDLFRRGLDVILATRPGS